MKKIAVSVDTDEGLKSPVSQHFGRCPYYVVVEVEADKIVANTVHKNPYAGSHRSGVMPEFIRSLGADVIISGGMGPRAIGFFQQLGIEPQTGVTGTVEEVVRRYIAGEAGGASPCGHSR